MCEVHTLWGGNLLKAEPIKIQYYFFLALYSSSHTNDSNTVILTLQENAEKLIRFNSYLSSLAFSSPH